MIASVGEADDADQIMHIENRNDPLCVRNVLQIGVGEREVREICDAYKSCYLNNLRADSRIPDFEMAIVLKHDQPISSRPRRLSFADKEALRRMLDELIDKGIIHCSDSSYASPIVLTKKRMAAFGSSKPVLAVYSPHADTELHCDASASGFGGILLQKQGDGTWRPISFWSQRTTPVEARYHSFELECLAVNYDYEIVHRPGKRMNHVDALSRCHSVLVLEGSTFERTLSVCQDRDKEISEIRDKLEKGDIKYYELRKGLVYRKDKNKKLLFYVPQSMEANVIRTCHDDLGHVRIDKMIKHVLIAVGTPRANGQVERFNRIIIPMLAKLSESPSDWDSVLHRIEYYLNNTMCRATSETPARLLFGLGQKGEPNDLLRDFLQLLKQQNTERYNLRRKAARPYKVGDYVEIRNIDTTVGINKKLIPKFKGPYVVKKVLDRYVVTDVDGFQLVQRPYTGVVAPDRMRPYVQN
ncbi:PREDICTED: uncharacterized protein LOC105449550 [Wasmannia auropunctata]|uniref:uncharacterized protein LOC105449550 n=1 Tax=Wasmannia auropunctata TaxID=64793 RepID=UPI0005EECA48|nr:PREDICTED: uncharacterized protein LOC105449550 [Wasmannia auropunctata]